MIHNRINPNRKPEFELFDHRRDPLNRKNVAEENPEVAQELAQEIDAWHKAAGAAPRFRRRTPAELGRGRI